MPVQIFDQRRVKDVLLCHERVGSVNLETPQEFDVHLDRLYGRLWLGCVHEPFPLE